MSESNHPQEGGYPSQNSDDDHQRPFGVTLLALGVLSLTGLNLARLILAISRWEFLAGLPGASPLYLSLTGLVWSAFGAVLFWSLWRGLSWALLLTRAFMLTYAAYYWLDRIFLSEHPIGSSPFEVFLPLNWPFAITITAVVMAITVWILSRPDTKVFFGEFYERRS